MKAKLQNYLFLFLLLLLASCSSTSRKGKDLPVIDVTKTYPEKTFRLSELADVNYVSLSTDSAAYLFDGNVLNVTPHNIVIRTRRGSAVLFFDEQGRPKSRISRKGSGPGEYNYVNKGVYDERRDEAYLSTGMPGNIKLMVYTSQGEYLRTLPVPPGTSNPIFYIFNDSTLLIHDNYWIEKGYMRKLNELSHSNQYSMPPAKGYDKSFVFISRKDGHVISYLDVPENDQVVLMSAIRLENNFWLRNFSFTARLLKNRHGYLVYNAETDTVYQYTKDKELVPVMAQTPPASSLDPILSMNAFVEAGTYQLIEVTTVVAQLGNPYGNSIMLARNTETGEINQAKIVMDDYEGKEVKINPLSMEKMEEPGLDLVELKLDELKEALDAGKLSGKLKELVASLSDDDNDVYMFVRMKP
ncbi:MAG: 6-bladed beta-propeller [Mediterranea sp.]|jgi:hypothetical protein|nr:6-bladed beta-propeller [Mediterranea sp.]